MLFSYASVCIDATIRHGCTKSYKKSIHIVALWSLMAAVVQFEATSRRIEALSEEK